MSVWSDWQAENEVRKLVRVTYIHKDAAGNSVYRFEFTIPGNIKGGFSGSQTLAVSKTSSGTWTFDKPAYELEDKLPSGDMEAIVERSLLEATIENLPDTRFDPGSFRSVGGEEEPLSRPSPFPDDADAARQAGYDKIDAWFRQGLFSEEDRVRFVIELSNLTNLQEIFQYTDLIPPEGGVGFDTGVGDGSSGSGSGSRGSRGSGATLAGPIYVAPDRRAIVDLVTGQLISLLGGLPENMVDTFVDLYLKDDRLDFENKVAAQAASRLGSSVQVAQQVDPTESVLTAIRNTLEYRTIHELRPDSMDERTWISNRRTAGEQGGLTVGRLEDFAITQATVGGDIADVREAAGFQQLAFSGQAPDAIQRKIAIAAQGLFQAVSK